MKRMISSLKDILIKKYEFGKKIRFLIISVHLIFALETAVVSTTIYVTLTP